MTGAGTTNRTAHLTEAAKDLREQAAERLADTVETLKPHLAAAYDSALELASEAGEQAKQKALPVVATGAAYAAEKAGEAKQRALETTGELSESLTAKAKRRKARRKKIAAFVGLGVLAAVAGIVAKKALGSSNQWETRVEPTPPMPEPDAAPPSVPTPGVARNDEMDAQVGDSAEDLAGQTLDDPTN